MKIINRSIGRYAKIDQHELRPYDDEAIVSLWPSGTALSPICVWPTFLQFWHTVYKNMKVSSDS